MKNFIRMLSTVLAASLLLSSAFAFTGCSKKENKLEIISEDQPWFNCKKFKLEVPYNRDEFQYLSIESPVYFNDSIYVVCSGTKIFDTQEAQGSDFRFNDYVINTICQFDLDGNLIQEITFDDKYEIGNIYSIGIDGDSLKVTCNAYNKDDRSYTDLELLIDPKTMDIKENDFELSLGSQQLIGEYTVGDSKVYLTTDYVFGYYMYNLLICSPDKAMETVNLNSLIDDIDFVDNCVVIDDNTLAIPYFADSPAIAEFTLSDKKAKKIDSGKSLALQSLTTVSNGKTYSSSRTGISMLNSNYELETVLDYNDANVNIYDMMQSVPLYVDDDFAVIEASVFKNNAMDTYIYTFDRADENPNIGKKVLDVFSIIPYVSYAESEAVVKFNKTNSEYFVRLRVADEPDSYEDEDYAKSMTTVSNQLMIDLLSGDGPDMVINGFDCDEFNNSDFFVDLNSLIDDDKSFDKSKYFDNIIEASKSDDGALYQMPVTFAASGIVAKVSDVGEGRIGFDFEDYERFVSEVCNGKSPLESSRNYFIEQYITSGQLEYIKDGKVDFNTEEFKSVAEFAKKNFPEKLVMESHIYNSVATSLTEPKDLVIQDMDILTMEAGGSQDPIGFYGYPAPSEHGLTAYIGSSAAISSEADEGTQKACWEFIKIMTSDEVQESVTDSLPMNKNAFKEDMNESIDTFNKVYDSYINSGFPDSLIAEMGCTKVNPAVYDSFFEAVTNITNVSRSDTSLYPILIEEMAAYFAGQKDIDSVIGIINDRAQTIYDERTTSKK